MFKKIYQTKRLLLLQSDASLAPRVLDFYSRNKSFFTPLDPTREDAFYTAAYQKKALKQDAADARRLAAARFWLVEKSATSKGQITGMVSLNNILYGTMQSATLSYKLDEHKTGQGFMTEALEKLIEIAFSELGLHRLEANIMPRNAPSLKLVSRLGFQNEGLAKDYLKINGAWEDHVHMALLNKSTE